MNWAGKRYWIVGASEGLGREVAKKIADAGAEVIVSARSEDRLKSLVADIGDAASFVTVDVGDLAAVKAAAARVGRIDGVVYLAGVYWPMNASEWDNEKADLMGQINYLGGSRVVGAVIGQMVDRDAGHVVLTGSLSGFRGLPGAIGYCASKAGLMALAESMQADLRKTGVRVQVINPGFIKTRLTEKNDFQMPFIMEPADAAQVFFDHMDRGGFKRSFPTVFSWLFRLSQFMPDWMYYRLFGAK
ncbi:MAG: SDR family NAD(P)-dependent oxidoreductase [Yoonia sp.]|nr:SDR family NAD(P)-dependent oxidoreductase [Yoonia sp.]